MTYIERSSVPCNGCTACCQGELVVLDPEAGDDPALYLTRQSADGAHHALQQKANGDCVYLGPSGCSIWARAPAMCRTFDCRKFFLRFNRAARRRMKDGKDIFDAGRARLGSLQ